MSEQRLHFDPSENALEFLIDAAEGLAGNPTKKQLKYATLHLVAAVEILFKVRLEEEHWTLLLPKFGRQQHKGELELFRSGLLPTVGAEEAARRLKDVVGLQIPDSIPGLKPLTKIRNGLVHHGTTVSAQEIQSSAGQILDYLITFMDAHLRDDEFGLREPFQSGIEKLRPLLAQIQTLVQVRMETLREQLKNEPVKLTCFACGNPTLIPGDHTCCPFCLGDFEPAFAAREYVETVLNFSEYEAAKEGGIFPLHHCPNCGTESFIDGVQTHDWDPGDDPHGRWWPRWLCMSCAEPYPSNAFDYCTRCQEPTETGNDEGIPVCENCYSYIAGD